MRRPDVPAISESKEIKVTIEVDSDIVVARQQGRKLAPGLGFSSSDATIVATAISELARNIVVYAKRGEIILNAVKRDDQSGVIVTARDQGMGIADLSRALQDGYSTSWRLGVGLPGVKRLMDEFDILSEVGKGTMVTVAKWLRGSGYERPASSPWQFNRPWGTADFPLDRGSHELERNGVEGIFTRSPEASSLGAAPPPGGEALDAVRWGYLEQQEPLGSGDLNPERLSSG